MGFAAMVVLHGCREVDNNPGTKDYFPILSLLQSQVAHVDSSVYPIMLIISRDSTFDTIHVRREQFRELADDFLSIPDITREKTEQKYKEDKFYDEDIMRAVLTYSAIDDKIQVRRQEVHILPNPFEGDKLTTIFIDMIYANRDSSVEKRMLWEIDKYFQVRTRIEKPGKPAIEKTEKVTWNE